MLVDVLYAPDGVNVALFRFFNGIESQPYQNIMRVGTALSDGFRAYYLMPFLFMLIGLLFYVQLRRARASSATDFGPMRQMRLQTMLVLVMGYGATMMVIETLKKIFTIPRPFQVLANVNQLDMDVRLDVSFPSGHAGFAMFLVASLWPVLGLRGRFLAIVYLLWVMASRMSLGVHTPADVIMGALVSLLVIMAVRAVVLAITKQKRFS